MQARHRNRFILAVAATLCCLPVFADLLFSWRHAPFRYFTSDAYYYLNVARHFAETGIPSFDGEHATNGFHPLWQVIVALLYKTCLFLNVSELTTCYVVVVLGACLTTLGVLIIGLTIRRTRGMLPSCFTLLPVGLYAFLLGPIWIYTQSIVRNISPSEGPLPLYGTTWSYVNGMESGVALVSYALLAFLWTDAFNASIRRALLIGLVGALVVLARLDQVFIAASILGFLASRWIAAEQERCVTRVLALSAGFSLPIAVYLFVNLLYCGLAFPVSGASKFSFRNVAHANLESVSALFTEGPSAPFWLDRLFRLSQILVPAFAAVAFLAISLRLERSPRGVRCHLRSRDDFSSFMVASAIGVLALCSAVFLFTGPAAYGSWSLPVPVLFVSLAFVSLLPGKRPARRSSELLRVLVLSCVAVAVFFSLHRQPEYHEKYRRFYMGRNAVVDAYGEQKPKMIEVDDGIIGFATHFHTLSALNLSTDKDLHQAIRENRLLPIARERGYDRIASLVYLPAAIDRTGAVALNYLASLYPDDERGRFSLEYFDPSLPFAIVRISYASRGPGR